MRLILMESPDRGGKTTQAKLLQEKLGYNYFKSTKQYGSNIDLEKSIAFDWRFTLDVLKSISDEQTLVFDRSFISQWVYSYCYRSDNIYQVYGSSEEYDNIFKQYCDTLQTFPHLVIWCKREDYTGVVDDVVDLSKVDTLKSLYETFFRSIGKNLNVITLNFEDGIKNNHERLMRMLK